jgi:coenzyme F420-0:L-glutamate ligase / coenzyme F420-1:gamma-L-glutamate ligase
VNSDFNEIAFWGLIQGRRSVRRYQARAIAPEVLEKLLTAAIWAPSAHNRQPWRFCVVTSAEAKAHLSDRMVAQWRQDLGADGADPAFIEQRVSISQARLMGAAALVIAAVSMAEMDVYPDARRNTAEWLMAVQSTALACQNLLLAAQHYGLGACWMCAPLFVPELVREVLTLPVAWQPQALITLGYPAEAKSKTREPLSSRVVWR